MRADAYDNRTVCVECWDRAYPEGFLEITLGLISFEPFPCAVCEKLIQPDESFHWMGGMEVEKQRGEVILYPREEDQ